MTIIRFKNDPNLPTGRIVVVPGGPGGRIISKIPPSTAFCPTDTFTPTELSIAGLTTVNSSASARGQLTASSVRAVKRGSTYYAQYFIVTNVPASTTYRFDMSSDTDALDPPATSVWDTYLYVINGPCSSNAIKAEDDDAGPGQDSQLSTNLVVGTNYLCECPTFNASATGYFSLKVTRTA
jgi:hypothetical protein